MTSSSRDLEVSGKLDAVFSCHSESSQNTFSERETEAMNQETVSRVVVILFSDLLTWQMLGNHFLMEIKIICLVKQGLNL